jgi:AsmA family protein
MTQRRRLLWAVAAAAVAIGTAAVAARLLVPPWLHSWIERAGSEAVGRELRIAGPFELSLSSRPTLVAEDLTLTNARWGSEPVMIRVARVKVSLDLWSLLSPPVRVEELEIDGVRILIEADAGGRGNWEFERRTSGAAAGPSTHPPLVFGHAAIRDLEVVVRSRLDKPPLRLGVSRLEARLDPATGMVGLEAAGHFNDAPWDFAGKLGTLDRLYELRDVENDVAGHVGASKLTLHGRIRDPLALGGPDLEAEIGGPDIAAALATVGLRSPLSGPFHARARLSPATEGVDVDLTAENGGVTAGVRGRVGALLEPNAVDARVELSGPDASVVGAWAKVEGLPKRRFEVAGHVRRDGPRFSVDDVRARVGGTSLAASGTIGASPRWVGTDLAVTASGTDLSELSALARLHLPATAFDARARVLRRADAIAVEDVEIRAKDAVVRAGGTIGEPPRLENLDMAFDASGPDLSRFSGVAKVELPHEPFALRGRIVRSGTAFDVEGVEGRLGDNAVNLEGTVGRAPRLAGSDLRVRIAGPDLARAGALVDLEGVPAGPYDVAGRIRIVPDGYRLDGVEAHAGRVTVRVDGRLGTRPAENGTELDSCVEGTALSDLAAWGVESGLPSDPFHFAGRLRIENRVVGIDRTVAEIGADRATIDGTLGRLPELSSLDIGVEAAGPSLADLGRFVSAAGGEPPSRLPAGPYTLSARIRLAREGLELREARATVGNAEIRLDGTLGSGAKLHGTDLRFEARAPDSALAAELAGVTLPEGPVELRGRVERVDAGFRFDGVSVLLGDAHAEISGTLGDAPERAGTAFEVMVEGPDLAAALGPVTGLSPLPSDAFEVSAHLEGSGRRIASKRFVARLGENDLEGSVSVGFEGRLAVEADLRSRHLGVPELLDGFLGEPASAPASPKRKRHERKTGLLLPDEPLALDRLRSLDAQVRLSAAEVALPGVLLHDVRVEASLRDGALRVGDAKGVGERGGRATASLSLEPADGGYRLRASGTLAGARFGLWTTGEAREQMPSLDLEFELEGAGGSLHEIAASSDGHALFTLGSGRVPSNLSDAVTSGALRGLLDALNPFRKSSPYTEVECGVVAAELKGGQMAVKPIAARTDRMTILGHGNLDFETERIDLVWALKPREGVGITAGSIANPYIKLGGTLSAPSLDAKPLEAVASTGAAVATAGLTLLFRGIYDRVTAEKKVCVKALEDAERQAEKRAARATP